MSQISPFGEFEPRFRDPKLDAEPHRNTKRRSPLRRMSARRRKRQAEINEAKQHLGEWCEARLDGCAGRATDPHHRRPQSLTSKHDLIPVCRPCHDWIETHPVAAVALGLSDLRAKP